MKQYRPEKPMGKDQSKRNLEDIKVGRGVLPPSLHGKHTLETKRELPANLANKVDLEEDLAMEVRKAVTLDYLEGGGDGKGDEVEERLSMFKRENPEWIDHEEIDEIYPKAG